jgi:selenide,water dikinase
VLVGISTGDDAAIFRLSADLALVLTVDFFTPIVDDPYDFGQISAANALSDVYAMGGAPLTALSIVSYPAKDGSLDALGRILRGAADKAKEAGIEIIGGHSVEDPEPKFGLAVTGTVHPERILANDAARPGDVLFLTKPLGSGTLTTAIKRGALDDDGVAEVTRVMATLNAAASKAAIGADAHACTDITGFGLLGHVRGMLKDRGLGARLSVSSIPLLSRFRELLRDGVYPGGTQRNLDYYGAWLRLEPNVPEETKLIVADPQTSGGLLIAVAADRAYDLSQRLSALGVEGWAEIGRITEDPTETISFIS